MEDKPKNTERYGNLNTVSRKVFKPQQKISKDDENTEKEQKCPNSKVIQKDKLKNNDQKSKEKENSKKD